MDATDPIRAAGKMNKLERLNKIIAQRDAGIHVFCLEGCYSLVSECVEEPIRGMPWCGSEPAASSSGFGARQRLVPFHSMMGSCFGIFHSSDLIALSLYCSADFGAISLNGQFALRNKKKLSISP